MGALRSVVRSLLPFAIGAIVFSVLQAELSASQEVILIAAGVNVILAVSLNVVNGFTGQFSLGHAGFMAVGAYTAAKITIGAAGLQILGLSVGVSAQIIFFLALLAGMVLAGLMGLVVGMPSLRLRGDYLAIVTLGFGEIIRILFNNAQFLGAATGYFGDSPAGLPPYSNLFWVFFWVVIVVTLTCVRSWISRYGMPCATSGTTRQRSVIASSSAGVHRSSRNARTSPAPRRRSITDASVSSTSSCGSTDPSTRRFIHRSNVLMR